MSFGQPRRTLQVWLQQDLVVGLGLLASPRKLCHCAEHAASMLGRHHLVGKLLWDLAIEGGLLELWEGKVTKAVIPLHELGLFVGG
jgi:hypothetical protein